MRKFFVEAKKPAVSIQTDIQPAYQLRRYAWTAKLPLSILTDFEEFSVYDCRFRPKPGDKASQARVLSLTYDHRAIDGASAARFLERVKGLVEKPSLALVR